MPAARLEVRMKKLILFSIILALGASWGRAAVVHLKGGGALAGDVVSSSDRQVVIDTSQGRVRVDASRIERIEPRDQSLSLDLGLAAPLSDIDFSGTSFGGVPGGQASNGDIGGRIGLQYLRFTSPRTGWGLEVAYAGRSTTDSPDLMPKTFSHVSGGSLLLMGNLKYSLTPDGEVRPYALLGAGAHYT